MCGKKGNHVILQAHKNWIKSTHGTGLMDVLALAPADRILRHIEMANKTNAPRAYYPHTRPNRPRGHV